MASSRKKSCPSRSVLILFIPAALFTAQPAHSQEQPVNPYWPLNLEEVTVTAGRLSAQVGAYSTFDSARIAEQSAVSLSDLLASVPGGVINVDERSEAALSLRGAIPRDTKLFIDGRPAASPWNGYIDLSGVSMSDIAEVSVIKGPAPLRYGGNLGGIVDIYTRKPGNSPRFDFSANFGSGGFRRAALSGGGKIADLLSIRASIVVDGRDEYPLPDDFTPTLFEDGGSRENSDNRRYSGSLAAFFPLLTGESSLTIGYSDEERGLPPKTIQEFPRDPLYWRFKDWRRYYAHFKHQRKFSSLNFENNFYYDVYTNRLKLYNDSSYDENSYIYDSIHLSRSVGWNGTIRFVPIDRFPTEIGLRAHYDQFSRKEQTPASGGFSPPLYDNTIDADLYAESVHHFSRIWEISAGLSLMSRIAEGGDVQLEPCGRLGIVLNPMMKLRLAANFARSAQYPQFFHLYDDVSGNTSLRPETALRGEIGAQWFFAPGTSLSLWRYHSFIEGRIDRLSRTDPFLNLTDAQLWGEEIVLERRGAKFTASASLTLQTVKLEQIPGSSFPLLGDDTPPWKANVYASVQPWNGIRLSINADYLAELTDYNGNEIAGHLLLDAVTSIALSTGLTLNGSVENAFDREYSLDYGFPQPGRIWKIGIGIAVESKPSFEGLSSRPRTTKHENSRLAY